MKHNAVRTALGVLVLSMAMGPAEAYTSKVIRTVSVGASGVTGTAVLDMTIVAQGNAADPAATLLFEGTTAALRDSGESLKLTVNANVAANRIIIYTNNSAIVANPKACINTGLGNDSGGLVGIGSAPICELTVPVVWGLSDNNTDYTFTPVALPGVGATNGVFITDLAHVATFTTTGSALDNLPMKRCVGGAVVANALNDGLYPQSFGRPNEDNDLCRQSDSTKVLEAEELSKNIAVVGFGFTGINGTGPNTLTAIATDTIALTSPIYLPLGADFRQAAGDVQYATSTLTTELVTQ
jgi:hypothetical protein